MVHKCPIKLQSTNFGGMFYLFLVKEHIIRVLINGIVEESTEQFSYKTPPKTSSLWGGVYPNPQTHILTIQHTHQSLIQCFTNSSQNLSFPFPPLPPPPQPSNSLTILKLFLFQIYLDLVLVFFLDLSSNMKFIIVNLIIIVIKCLYFVIYIWWWRWYKYTSWFIKFIEFTKTFLWLCSI